MTAVLRMTAISVMLFMLVSATACVPDRTPDTVPDPNPIEDVVPDNKVPDLDLDLDGNDKIDNNWDNKEDKK